MANMLDYIDWRGDITFSRSEFNDIDNLIFSQLSYLDFNGMVPATDSTDSIDIISLSEKYFAEHRTGVEEIGIMVPDQIGILLEKMARSARFRNIRFSNYINNINYEKELQFSAVTITIDDGSSYIAFGGTDDTIVGWKEDFNMSFMSVVPAQEEALRYLNIIGHKLDGGLRIGGHSKGGNLAVYAALHCDKELKKRFIKIYNNDGPGFSKKIIDTPEYALIADRVKTIVPESSIVGILMEHEEKLSIVKSREKGLFQHNAFSWEVLGPSFLMAEERTSYSEISDLALRSWLADIDTEERVTFVDTLFDILESTDAKTFMDLNENKMNTALSLIKTFKGLDDDKKEVMGNVIGALFKQNIKAAASSMFKDSDKKEDKEKKRDEKKKENKPKNRFGGKRYITIKRV